MIPMSHRWPLALVLLGASSCGTIVGRIPFQAPGEGRTVVTLDAGRDVRFWSDVDLKRSIPVRAELEIELFQGGARVAATTCNPLVGGWSRFCTTRFVHESEYDANCRMACSARVPKSGPTEVRARLYVGGWNELRKIVRADVVVRQ